VALLAGFDRILFRLYWGKKKVVRVERQRQRAKCKVARYGGGGAVGGKRDRISLERTAVGSFVHGSCLMLSC
jgi:hypothetical protein